MRHILFILKRIWALLLHLIFPPKCSVCKCALHRNTGMCNDCLKLYNKAERKRCGICLKQARNCSCRPMLLTDTDKFSEKNLISLFYLAPPESKAIEDKFVRKFIYKFKRYHDRASVGFVSRILSHEFLVLLKSADENTDNWIITNPPRSKEQRLIYGFDHASQLARTISKMTGIEYSKCFKRRTNKMQKTLNAFQRRANADKAYSAINIDSFIGKKVLIIDDVMTTGATINACAKLLKDNGAKLVFPACIARTRKKPVNARRALSWNNWINEKKKRR